eukprot:176623_1
MLLQTIALFLSCNALSPSQLQSQLSDAINNPDIGSYTIPNGNYHFINTDFIIAHATNFSIYSSSSTIISLNCSYQVLVINNSNVTISNISVDYDPPCFSQGIINDINITESSLIISVDKGYPLPDKTINDIFNAKIIKVIYWNATTRNIIVGQQTSNPMKSSLQLNKNKYKIYLQKNISTFMPSINDLVTISPRVGGNVVCATNCSAFICVNCSNVLIDNLIIYSSSNMALVEMYGQGNNIYNNYQLIRKYNSTHLLTANADAFHSTVNLYGPTLKNSHMMYPADDFVNVHNRLNILLERISDYETYIIDTDNGSTLQWLKANDYIYFYQLNSLNYFGYGIVESFYMVTNETIIQQARDSENVLESPPYNAHFIVNYTDLVKVYYVKFKNKLEKNITGYWALVEIDLNNNALIENNICYNGYSSVVKIKSNGAIVQNNYAYSTHGGMQLKASQNWLEGELGLKNIIVRNNIFYGCDINENNAIIVQKGSKNITLFNNTVLS